VVIVGGGTIGTSTALELAGRGAAVTLLDKGPNSPPLLSRECWVDLPEPFGAAREPGGSSQTAYGGC
jgi:glycine/D-amino acid oxidase-like deaminating enzyme